MTVLLVLLTMMVASAGPVSDGLRTTIAICKAEHDRWSADGRSPQVYVLEPGNGFAQIAGRYPTCGCSCSATGAAFRVADGSYRFLGREEWDCESTRGLTGEDWGRVLPADLRSKLLPKAGMGKAPAVAFLDTTLPQKGTDTTLRLAMLPIGMEMSCPGRICDRMSPSDATTRDLQSPASVLDRLIKAGMPAEDLKTLGRNGPASLSALGQAIAVEVISKDDQDRDREEQLLKLQAYLSIALKRWEWVRQLAWSELALRWNREKGVFEVDQARSKPSELKTFLDYLQVVEGFWGGC